MDHWVVLVNTDLKEIFSEVSLTPMPFLMAHLKRALSPFQIFMYSEFSDKLKKVSERVFFM